MNPEIRKFWQTADFRHINPAADTEFPEGWDVREELRDSLADRSVAEIGCGYGRLCAAFQAERYVGYDLSPTAIAEARRRFPAYRFTVMSEDNDFAPSEAVLLYTVLLHVDDNDIGPFIERLAAKTNFVLVAEIMGRAWRRAGDPPVFNRERQEYVDMFARQGFALDDIVTAPYARYKNTQITFLAFTNQRPVQEGLPA